MRTVTFRHFLIRIAYSGASARFPDRAGKTIDVLGTASLTKHEGSRLGAGALLLGRDPGSARGWPTNPDAIPYSIGLNEIRSFYRICDGVQTMAVVDPQGCFIEVADIRDWAGSPEDVELPIPGPTRYGLTRAP